MSPLIAPNCLTVESVAARQNRSDLAQAGVVAMRLRGGPGCGKTSLIEATLRRLPEFQTAIVVAEIAGGEERARLRDICDQVIDAQVGPDAAMQASDLQRALERIDLEHTDLLLVEDPGPLRDAPDLGVDTTVSVFSVASGSDKPLKHPDLVRNAALVVLNKVDLLPRSRFDVEQFRSNVVRLSPGRQILELSALEQTRLEGWLNWVADRIAGHPHGPPAQLLPAEWFFG